MSINHSSINNSFYNDLGERWYTAQADPVALLRAESRLHSPWIVETCQKQTEPHPIQKILDVGCGGGFISNYLAQRGFEVTGIDLSEESLEVARKYDVTQKVNYQIADAYSLPFEDSTFDSVIAMDFLEHVEDLRRTLKEISRVLKPGGLFFFHTFNKNPLAALVVIKGVEWFVKNTPPKMHVYSLFIKPHQLKEMCSDVGLEFQDLQGCGPVIPSRAFLKLLLKREVPADFRFHFTKSKVISYSGYAVKVGGLLVNPKANLKPSTT